VGSSGLVRAGSTVNAGWDLFTTQPGTIFAGAPFTGVPLNTFNFNSGTNGDFGRGIGTQNVDGTDTIIKRLEAATAGEDHSTFTNADLPGVPPLPGIGQSGGPPVFSTLSSATGRVDLEVSALQLMTSMAVNLGFGNGIYFETLQSNRSTAEGGPGLMGRGLMDITFGPEGIPHGTFNSWLYIPIDLRLGSATAPIVASDTLLVTGTDVPWSHFPWNGALLIGPQVPGMGGANYLLNGTDQTTDFWPGVTAPGRGSLIVEKIISVNGNLGIHIVGIPEPSSVVLLGLGALGICGYGRRHRERAA